MFCFRRSLTRFIKYNEFPKSGIINYGRNQCYMTNMLHRGVCSIHSISHTSSIIVKFPNLQPQINLKFSSSKNESDKKIGIKEFNNLLKSKKIYVIDVREKEELKRMGSIPNSLNIPLGQIKEALKKSSTDFETEYGKPKPSQDDQIVIYCQRGPRSMKALKEAVKQGYKNSKMLEGGWLQWNDNEREKKK